MRDAIGGVVNIQLILVFIAVVSGYLAFSVSYTKAVHVKDFIINKIEEYEDEHVSNGLHPDAKADIEEYMRRVGYHGVPSGMVNADVCKRISSTSGSGEGQLIEAGEVTRYAICKFEGAPTNNGTDENPIPRSYYGVVTYITIDIPIINKLMANLRFFEISGKTRLLEDS